MTKLPKQNCSTYFSLNHAAQNKPIQRKIGATFFLSGRFDTRKGSESSEKIDEADFCRN